MSITSIVEINVSLEDSEHEYCEDCYVNTPPSFSQEHVEIMALISTVANFDNNLSLNEFLEFFSSSHSGTENGYGVTKQVSQTKRLSFEQSVVMQSIPVFSGFIDVLVIEELYRFIANRVTDGELPDQELIERVKDHNPDAYKVFACLIEKAKIQDTYSIEWYADLFDVSHRIQKSNTEEACSIIGSSGLTILSSRSHGTAEADITRDDFMAFFRDEEKFSTLSNDDRVELFSQALPGSSDFTADLLNSVLNDYCVEHLTVVEQPQ